MVDTLQEAISKAEHLSEEEQRQIAEIVEEKLDELNWQRTLASPESKAFLDKLVKEALEEERQGHTTPLKNLL